MNLKTSTPVWRLGALAAVLALALPAAAVTLRIANQGDALSMDPHSLNESLQITVVENVYEPLIWRDDKFKLTPVLATSWKQTAPTVWRFELRKGVTFHDGTPFTADQLAAQVGDPEKTELVFKILEHLAANKGTGIKKRPKTPWHKSTYRSA